MDIVASLLLSRQGIIDGAHSRICCLHVGHARGTTVVRGARAWREAIVPCTREIWCVSTAAASPVSHRLRQSDFGCVSTFRTRGKHNLAQSRTRRHQPGLSQRRCICHNPQTPVSATALVDTDFGALPSRSSGPLLPHGYIYPLGSSAMQSSTHPPILSPRPVRPRLPSSTVHPTHPYLSDQLANGRLPSENLVHHWYVDHGRFTTYGS